MTVTALSNALKAKEVCLPYGEREITGAYVGDLLSWVMGRAKSDNVWITIMSNVNVIAVATLADVSSILLAEGVNLPDEVLEVAKNKGVNVLKSDLPIYDIALKIAKLMK